MAGHTLSLSRLLTFYGHLEAEALLAVMIKEEFKGEIALVSSFGAGSALLIDMVARIDPYTPVLFLETHKHFPETLAYVAQLRETFGLKDVRFLTPDPEKEKKLDPEGMLWKTQPNRCCWFRKVEPLQRELEKSGFKALITGRKKYQTQQRAEMDTIELHEDGRFRINPLANWDSKRITGAFKERNLIEHPLKEKGYFSIGCEPCTRPVKSGEDERAGRWAHTAELPGGEKKVECGIHLSSKEGGMPSKPEWNI